MQLNRSTSTATSPEHTSSSNGQSVSDVLGLADQLKSHSADEVLGSMKQASLMNGIGMATVLTVVLMAVLTIGPYLRGSSKKKDAKPAVAASKKEQAPAASPDAADATAGESANAPAGTPKVNEKTMKNLAVDEVKQSDPQKNPLENSLEDLLKDTK